MIENYFGGGARAAECTTKHIFPRTMLNRIQPPTKSIPNRDDRHVICNRKSATTAVDMCVFNV